MKKTHLKIGNIVREHRERKGLTQMEVASRLGYDSPQFVSLFERGLSKVPVTTLGRLITILGIPEKTITHILLSDYEVEVRAQIAKGKEKAAR
jgi:transcriptional regulator with XRE-family HTH domain